MKGKIHKQLQLLVITTVEKRRQRVDLIEVYTMISLVKKISIRLACRPIQFAFRELNLLNFHLKLYNKPCSLHVRKYFSQSIISFCNLLPNQR